MPSLEQCAMTQRLNEGSLRLFNNPYPTRHDFEHHRKSYPIIVSHLTEPLVTVTSTCVNLLLEQTSTSGIILSTNNSDYNYNSNSNYYYDNDMDCQWNLTSTTKVELTFYTFNTELDADYLYVYDGGSSSSPMIGSFSGTSLPSPITSSSNKLHIRFTSNTSVRRRGFRASYRGKAYSYDFEQKRKTTFKEMNKTYFKAIANGASLLSEPRKLMQKRIFKHKLKQFLLNCFKCVFISNQTQQTVALGRTQGQRHSFSKYKPIKAGK